MQGLDPLSVVSVIIGGVNLVTLLAIAFHGGRWVGRVDTRLGHLEQHIERR